MDEGPSKTIYRWCSEFKRDRLTLGDELRSGRPTTAITKDAVLAFETEPVFPRLPAINKKTVHQLIKQISG
ncbi:hypothetical protein evm_011144 [Chilo suppressalis]|nr:hypothetical protein evm_011144 [Chilo suppressalis]